MAGERPGYIVVEGPIGVGKTSLARRLAESFETDLVLEGSDENPFLERFYEDPRAGALPAQLFFLFQRARQIEAMRQADMFQPVRVTDFMMEKDRLFAELTLDAEELKLYQQVYDHVTVDATVNVKSGSAGTWPDFAMPHAGLDHVPAHLRIYPPLRTAAGQNRRRVAKYDRSATSVREPCFTN